MARAKYLFTVVRDPVRGVWYADIFNMKAEDAPIPRTGDWPTRAEANADAVRIIRELNGEEEGECANG